VQEGGVVVLVSKLEGVESGESYGIDDNSKESS